MSRENQSLGFPSVRSYSDYLVYYSKSLILVALKFGDFIRLSYWRCLILAVSQFNVLYLGAPPVYQTQNISEKGALCVHTTHDRGHLAAACFARNILYRETRDGV